MPFYSDIQKPTLILNEARCRANIARMADKARRNTVRFRPHFKTHQCAAIGDWFREWGVTAITVSSVDMASYFAGHGWRDITIAFSLNWRQIEAINDLAGQIHLGLLFESPESLAYAGAHLTHPVDGWIKIDGGAHRTGIPFQNTEEVIALAGAMAQSGRIRLKGLLTHAGNTYHASDRQAVVSIYQESVAHLKNLAGNLEQAGYMGVEVSVGDTPSCSLVDDLLGVDEIRPGNFVFFDAMQWQIGSCTEEEIAVGVACPVVAHHAERNEIVIYGGAIHLSKEMISMDGHSCFGLVAYPTQDGWGKFLPGAYVSSLSQEHGLLKVAQEDFHRIQIGDLLVVIPVHSCLAVACLQYYVTSKGTTLNSFRSDYS